MSGRNPDDARHEDCGPEDFDMGDLDDTADGEPADLEAAFAAVLADLGRVDSELGFPIERTDAS